MTFQKKIERYLERYNFNDAQKAQFLLRARAIVDSNIAKEYKLGLIIAWAEYVAREPERNAEVSARMKNDEPKQGL